MTIIEIFPWVTAIGVILLLAPFLSQKAGLSNGLAWLIALLMGVTVRMLFWIIPNLALRFCRDDDQREKRVYRELYVNKSYPAAKKLYYECRTCGNALPSISRKNIACKCRNINIGARPAHIEIRDVEKARSFTKTR
jgi:hypothetical protein